jgi:hypothetical protein
LLLKRKRRTHRIRCPRELRDERVPAYLVRDTPVVLNGLGESPERSLDPLMRERLIELHEPRRPGYIGMQDDGEPAGGTLYHRDSRIVE